MSEHYRERRMSELMQAFRHEQVGDRWRVRNRETGELVERCDYDQEALAIAGARMATCREIERLFVPDRATARARVAAIIAEQSDQQWAADLICDFFEGARQ